MNHKLTFNSFRTDLDDDKRLICTEYPAIKYYHFHDIRLKSYYIIIREPADRAFIKIMGNSKLPNPIEMLEDKKLPEIIRDVIITHLNLFSN